MIIILYLTDIIRLIY